MIGVKLFLNTTHPFSNPFTQPFIHPFIHSFTQPFIHPFTQPFIHLPSHSFTHSHSHSSTHSHSYSHSHSFTHSHIHSSNQSPTHKRITHTNFCCMMACDMTMELLRRQLEPMEQYAPTTDALMFTLPYASTPSPTLLSPHTFANLNFYSLLSAISNIIIIQFI